MNSLTHNMYKSVETINLSSIESHIGNPITVKRKSIKDEL